MGLKCPLRDFVSIVFFPAITCIVTLHAEGRHTSAQKYQNRQKCIRKISEEKQKILEHKIAREITFSLFSPDSDIIARMIVWQMLGNEQFSKSSNFTRRAVAINYSIDLNP